MHCAKLFDICKDEDCDIFSQAEEEAKKKARRVCISAILHTDNVHHFEMVKQISTTYEIVAEICEAQACARGEIAPRTRRRSCAPTPPSGWTSSCTSPTCPTR